MVLENLLIDGDQPMAFYDAKTILNIADKHDHKKAIVHSVGKIYRRGTE